MAGVFLCIYTCRQYTLRQREVFKMKLVLNRNEVLELKKLASTMGNICGDDVSRVMEMVDKQITTKKFIMSMVTGQFTFEVKEEFIVGLLNITNELAIECSPVLKACVNLGQALVPTFTKFAPQYASFMEQYRDDEPVKESNIVLQKHSSESDWKIKTIATKKTKEVV